MMINDKKRLDVALGMLSKGITPKVYIGLHGGYAASILSIHHGIGGTPSEAVKAAIDRVIEADPASLANVVGLPTPGEVRVA
jgi:hypothetical protein